MKKICKYSLLFCGTLLCCIILLFFTSLIPQSSIKTNSEKSALYLNEKEDLFNTVVQGERLTTIDNYADTILLNIVYNLDEKQPLRSVFLASYYKEDWLNANEAYKITVTENKSPNTPYTRYWHGMMILLKPLLMFLDIRGIRIFNAVVILALMSCLGVLLFKKNQKILLSSMIIGFISIGVFFVPLCLEYTSTFIIMLAACIFALLIEAKGDDKLLPLFFIIGMLTCFFDFLTTETITLTMPLIMVLCVRYKAEEIKALKSNLKESNKTKPLRSNLSEHNKTKSCINTEVVIKKEGIQYFKNVLNFSIKAGILWCGAYMLMWLAKWGLSSIILKINAFEAALEQAEVRAIGNVAGSLIDQYIGAIFRNIALLFPLNYGKTYGEVILLFLGIAFVTFCVLFLYRKNKDKLRQSWFLKLLMLIGIVPYIRYVTLSNHSYLHYFFTYRAQLVTVTVLTYAFLESLDKKMINKDFSKLKSKLFRG